MDQRLQYIATFNSSAQGNVSHKSGIQHLTNNKKLLCDCDLLTYRPQDVQRVLYPPTTALAVPSWKDQARESASTKCSCFSRQSIRCAQTQSGGRAGVKCTASSSCSTDVLNTLQYIEAQQQISSDYEHGFCIVVTF